LNVCRLGRATDDPFNTFPGELTIGEVLPGYEAVLSQPKLPVTMTDEPLNQHWMVLLDSAGMSVNGKNVSLPKTVVTATRDPSQLTVVFDTGFSLPQLPKQMVDAIYSGAKGAQFDKEDNVWVVPCETEISVTFYLGASLAYIMSQPVLTRSA
jgi:hypothetical protein